MRNFGVLVDALAYIEANLCAPIGQRDIAGAVHGSLSSVQKLFRTALHVSIKEYLDRRRMTLAARDILMGDMSILQVAMKYQYNSPEVFSRAFARAWGDSPAAYRKKWRFSGLYPKLLPEMEGERIVSSKRVDLGELYDELNRKRGGYVLCFDICGLTTFNELSREAGDQAILAGLKRIDEAASDDMLLFRMGGDEFALVTGLTDEGQVRAIGERVLSQNGQPVSHQGRELPLSMWASAVRFGDEKLRYADLFASLQRACDGGKARRGTVVFA